MSCYFEKQKKTKTSNKLFRKKILENYKNTVWEFIKITKNISLFKMVFFLIFLFELFFSFFLIFNYYKSSIVAIFLGIIIITIFAYFSFLFYFQTKKPQQLEVLQKRFISHCRHLIAAPRGVVDHHLSMAETLIRMNYYLSGIESSYFSFRLSTFKFFSDKISIYFHFEDIFKMQERLLFSAIEEHFFQVKKTPLDLELHVSLANAYMSLAKLYLDIKKQRFKKFAKKHSQVLKEKFEIASKWAIEEFVILKEFVPNDPWIHSQLAHCYHCLEMFEEEIKEYEMMLELSTNDNEIKFRLGKRYFQYGRNAEGLQIYEELKKEQYIKAEELLLDYSAIKGLEKIKELS